MIRYYEALFDRPGERIFPGEYFVTSNDMVVSTLLGSCVSACIRDATTGMIGMNHFMLTKPGKVLAMTDRGRYGFSAMDLLIDAMVHRGANRETLEAKVFGGGVVLGEGMSTDVGRINAEFVLEDLEAKGITVLAADLRGATARKIYFEQRNGLVHVRYVRDGAHEEAG